jgi:anti-sigma-K factor RskA
MIDERQQELASLYAFDLLEGAERVQFETELARDPELRALVDELRSTATSLAHTAAPTTPPEALKSRIMASTAAAEGGAAESKVVRFPGSYGFMQFVPWAAAAAFALCTAWFAERYMVRSGEAESLRLQQSLAEIALKTATAQTEAERIVAGRALAEYNSVRAEANTQISEANRQKTEAEERLAEAERRATSAHAEVVALNDRLKREADLARLKIATLASMLHNSPQALAVAVWDPARQEGVFTVDQLPANTDDQRYELWVIDGKPVSAGVFTVGADGRARVQFRPTAPIATASKFAVSREKNDGRSSHATPAEVIMISQ